MELSEPPPQLEEEPMSPLSDVDIVDGTVSIQHSRSSRTSRSSGVSTLPSVTMQTLSADAAKDKLLHKSSKAFAAVMELFITPDMTYDVVWQTSLIVQTLAIVAIFALVGICISAQHMGLTGLTSGGEVRAQHFTQVMLNLGLCFVCIAGLLYVYSVGLTTRLKMFVLISGLFYCIASSTVWRTAPFQLLLIPLVDVAHILNAGEDKGKVEILATLMVASQLAFLAVYLFAELSEGGLLSWHSHEKTNWFGFITSTMIPPVMNHFVLKSFLKSSKVEIYAVLAALDECHKAAEFLANFDLDKADVVLSGSARSSSSKSSGTNGDLSMHVTEPLRRLLVNLRSYKVFLPQALFSNESDFVEDFCQTQCGNESLRVAMEGCRTDWDSLEEVVDRIREPAYSLNSFEVHMNKCFPEICLYSWDNGKMSSGLNGDEELQRTMSALFSVYALCRLDIDGKEVFTFGVDQGGRACRQPTGEDAAKLQTFYDTMAWDRAQSLMESAGVFRLRNGQLSIIKERLKVLLVLTAVHDVMKNTGILPVVQKRHKEYYDYKVGDTINDHDLALAYILEHFPHILPSYAGLEPSLRAPILFTQGKMGFNNGWLVQGEAPPGALLRQFKKIIDQGHASSADVNLYFVHWLTDLAGAVPYGTRQWPGAEKFTLKFPVKVLCTFLDSFAQLDSLAYCSEVEVMESYLESRWDALGHPPHEVSSDSLIAAQRLALMAQGFERHAISELECLPETERQILITELARTGCREEFRNGPSHLRASPGLGPALLVYYAPALLQKAKAEECGGALRVLSAVMRAARTLFPLSEERVEDSVIIRIDALKVLSPAEIKAEQDWHLRKIGSYEAEVGAGCAASLVQCEDQSTRLRKWGSRVSVTGISDEDGVLILSGGKE